MSTGSFEVRTGALQAFWAMVWRWIERSRLLSSSGDEASRAEDIASSVFRERRF